MESGSTDLQWPNGKYENNLNTNVSFGKVRPLQNILQKRTRFGNTTCFFLVTSTSITRTSTCTQELIGSLEGKSSQECALCLIYTQSLKKWFQLLTNYVVMSCSTGKQETHLGREEDALHLFCFVCSQLRAS